jgi:hypothetical protein
VVRAGGDGRLVGDQQLGAVEVTNELVDQRHGLDDGRNGLQGWAMKGGRRIDQ